MRSALVQVRAFGPMAETSQLVGTTDMVLLLREHLGQLNWASSSQDPGLPRPTPCLLHRR